MPPLDQQGRKLWHSHQQNLEAQNRNAVPIYAVSVQRICQNRQRHGNRKTGVAELPVCGSIIRTRFHLG